jgi:hypothetical protein
MKALLIIVLATAAVNSAGEWFVTTVDDGPHVGMTCSLALDAADNPHIVYFDWTYKYLKYAYFNGTTWEFTVVDGPGEGEAGWYCNIELDSAGRPHVSYWNVLDNYTHEGELRYAQYDGAGWDIEIVDDGTSGMCASMALDSFDHPHISYGEYITGNRSNLRYSHFDGTKWNTEIVDDDGDVGICTSIAVDSADHPHISYRDDFVNSEPHLWLKYAHHDGVSWCIETVDKSLGTGIYTSIAVDDADRPHISYQEDVTEALKYAYYDGAQWNIAIADDDHVNGDTSIALDGDGRPHIAYSASWGTGGPHFASELRYAYYDGAAWHVEVIDKSGEDSILGDFISLALGSADEPHVAYEADYENFEREILRYAFSFGDYLDYFTAAPGQPGTLVLRWSLKGTPAGEFLGYNLYRRDAGSEGDWLSLNDESIAPEEPYSFTDSGLVRDFTYEYMLEGIREGGAPITLGTTAGTPTAPTVFSLYDARPNPSTTSAVIPFELYDRLNVNLAVYDISGRKVATLAEEWIPPGAHERTISGLAPGVYVYKLEAEDYSEARKMVVVD